jgi:acetylornithine deacetylase/succinyl-diaminopimelate desuccinylase-like protein
VNFDAVIAALLAHPAVRAARAHIERSDDATLASQAMLSAIPAPTGAEGARARRVAEALSEAGLTGVTTDRAGNVLAWLGEPAGAAPMVLAAHLDTAFGPDVAVGVTRRGTRLEGPGVSDNARGIAALVTVAAALVRAGARPRRPLVFAATVGEEGAGNLRGTRYLFDGGAPHPLRPHAFVALDGAGVQRVVHRALGSRRYRVTFRGPGGHSWAAFGVANPAAAVGRAAAALADLPAPGPDAPRSTCAVVRIGGGTALNSIPAEAWLDVDLRSEAGAALDALERQLRAATRAAAEAEDRRRAPGTQPLAAAVTLLGERPAGVTPRAHPLVQAALAANRALGWDVELAAASTDANVPIALGVPAIALGAGGRGGDVHRTTEWYENVEGPAGVLRALLVTLAMTELA